MKIKRIIGVAIPPIQLKWIHAYPHSFLKIGENEHFIDNTFSEGRITGVLMDLPKNALVDEDPGTTTRPFGPGYNDLEHCLGVGKAHARLVCGQDEKMDQKMSYRFHIDFYHSYCLTLYDIEMRRYIKRKYGVEIESVVKKWSRLCWNCFEQKADLKKCSKCRIAQYCNKECQAQDWTVHKKLHAYEVWF